MSEPTRISSMQAYCTLGNTGLRVSRLALGTMTFGTEMGWGCDEATARTLFNRYLDVGGNFIDTADVYTHGNSETMLGRFIGERQARDQVVLASKFTQSLSPGNPNAGGNGRKNILRAIEASLKRLQTDYLDLYILHMWDVLTRPEEVMRTLDDLVRAGKVRHIGLSDVPAWYAASAQTMAELRGWETVSSIQMQYSLLERNIEHEYVPMALNQGMGITAWSPLANGLLSGKYRSDDPQLCARGRQAVQQQQRSAGKLTRPEELTDRNLAILAELEAVAAELGRNVAQVALNWVANRAGVASVLIGASQLEQMESNLQALEFSIAPELMSRLELVSRQPRPFPYGFFRGGLQRSARSGCQVLLKHKDYYSDGLVESGNR